MTVSPVLLAIGFRRGSHLKTFGRLSWDDDGSGSSGLHNACIQRMHFAAPPDNILHPMSHIIGPDHYYDQSYHL